MLFRSFNVGHHIALIDVGTLFGIDFNQFSTQSCGNFKDLSVVILNVAEEVALFVFLANEGLNRG